MRCRSPRSGSRLTLGQLAPQPQLPPQQPPPPPPLAPTSGEASDPEPAWTATRLMSGMLARLSQLGQTAATSRSAIGRSNSNTAEQSLQRYSYRGIATSVRTIRTI